MSGGRRGGIPPGTRGDEGAGLPDIEAVLEVLTAHRVRFVVIGGVAVAHHGFTRATRDVDIVPDPDPENLERLYVALSGINARPLALGELRPDEMPVPFSADALRQLGNWDLGTDLGRVDVMQFVAGKLESDEDYRELARRAEPAAFDFGVVMVTGFDDLVDFKTLAGRDQDLTDLSALYEARGDTERE